MFDEVGDDVASGEGTGRTWVRTRIIRELSARQWNQADLVRSSGLTPDTISDFLTGKRWPQHSTQAKIAEGLGWSADSLSRIERGLEPETADHETVGPADQDGGVLLDMPPEVLDGLDPMEREEVITAAKLSALEKAREIRRRIDG